MRAHWFPVISLSLAACAGTPDASDDETDTTEYPLPTVRIGSPEDGATVIGTEVTLELVITDFKLTGPEATALRRQRSMGPLPAWPLGSALWNASVPQSVAHTPGSEPAGYISVTVDGEEVQQATASPITLTGLELGRHDLGVELLYPDGDGFFPAAADEIAITFVAP